MSNDERRPDTAGLRRQAEQTARGKSARLPENVEAMSADEIRHLLHELRVHQIELEMQNEELRQAQVELDAARARYFDLYDLAPVGYWTLNDKGMIAEVNLTAAAKLGVAKSALVGQAVSRFILPDDQDIFYRHRQQILATGERQVCELRMGKKDGTPLWTRLEAVVAQDADGSTVSRYVMIDISERKRADAEREELKAHLLQMQKMEAIGRLAGGVAHDFNNMLAVILGNVELARQQVGPTHPLYARIEEIRHATEHSTELARQLLAFARKQTASPKVLELNDAVVGMLKMLNRLIGENIGLAWLPGNGLWPVKIDPHQLDQILANLCVNARDAVAGTAITGTGQVAIETKNVTCDRQHCTRHVGLVAGDYVLLAVKDNGCGMARETMDKLFEPFFTTKEIGKGTGMGLATVYGIVQQNHGFIDVRSEPGQGTTFDIYLPNYDAITKYYYTSQGTTFDIYLPRHYGKIEVQRKESPKSPAHGCETILLVEDEPAVLKITATMLEYQGYTVLAATSPDMAISMAETAGGKIDLLLTDVIMPKMNGRDLAAKLQSRFPKLKKVFMSGYTANIIAENSMLDEKVHFIQKPFSMKDLAAKVRETLDGE